MGYYDRPSVVNESLFAFDLLHDKLKSTRMPVAAALTAFSSDLLKARPEHQRFAQARMNSSSSSSFRPPTRKMVKDDVRDAWVDDLASGRNLGDLIKAGIPL